MENSDDEHKRLDKEKRREHQQRLVKNSLRPRTASNIPERERDAIKSSSRYQYLTPPETPCFQNVRPNGEVSSFLDFALIHRATLAPPSAVLQSNDENPFVRYVCETLAPGAPAVRVQDRENVEQHTKFQAIACNEDGTPLPNTGWKVHSKLKFPQVAEMLDTTDSLTEVLKIRRTIYESRRRDQGNNIGGYPGSILRRSGKQIKKITNDNTIASRFAQTPGAALELVGSGIGYCMAYVFELGENAATHLGVIDPKKKLHSRQETTERSMLSHALLENRGLEEKDVPELSGTLKNYKEEPDGKSSFTIRGVKTTHYHHMTIPEDQRNAIKNLANSDREFHITFEATANAMKLLAITPLAEERDFSSRENSGEYLRRSTENTEGIGYTSRASISSSEHSLRNSGSIQVRTQHQHSSARSGDTSASLADVCQTEPLSALQYPKDPILFGGKKPFSR